MTADVQLALPLGDLITPDYEPEATLADRFEAFHAANPHVADALQTSAPPIAGQTRKSARRSA